VNGFVNGFEIVIIVS